MHWSSKFYAFLSLSWGDIEHYVDPETRSTSISYYAMWNWCPWIDNVEEAGQSTIKWVKAVDDETIATETLVYFFCLDLPLLAQIWYQISTPLPRYWLDRMSDGDRAAFDLSIHSVRTSHPLVVRKTLKGLPVVTHKESQEYSREICSSMTQVSSSNVLELDSNRMTYEFLCQVAVDYSRWGV